LVDPIWPQPWATSPESQLFGDDTAWRESELFDVVDLNDPDFPYVADAVQLMRLAGFDMTDPAMLQLAVDAGHRKAATARDDASLAGHDGLQREWRRAEERGIELPGHCSVPSVVYYMRLGNRVKIGWTNNLAQRVSQIQPEELLATEPGGVVTETERHEQFKTLRVVGEWFRYEGSLVDHISRLRGA
jgi:hypothetical protein